MSAGSIGASEDLYLTSPGPATRRRAIDRFASIIRLAHEYGVDASIGRFRGSTKIAGGKDAAFGWFREATSTGVF